MSKKDKKKVGQWDHYRKWTTDQGYTFLAETKEDAIEYLKHMEHSNLGSLKEVKDVWIFSCKSITLHSLSCSQK